MERSLRVQKADDFPEEVRILHRARLSRAVSSADLEEPFGTRRQLVQSLALRERDEPVLASMNYQDGHSDIRNLVFRLKHVP
jgi:hypothetical protein